ncbi:BLUF domain-containing protein [bacterium]|nr:BLUF domain-containing protein [candidate division CSSED10-310 bacterium]
MMKRIKYISRFAKSLSSEDIRKLVEVSAKNNERDGITGVLLSSGCLFFQIIEGPKEKIDTLYEKIVADDRHTNVLMLNAEECVKERLFPDWSMKQIALDDTSIARLEPLRQILETVIEARQRIEKLTSTLERAIWSELVLADQ